MSVAPAKKRKVKRKIVVKAETGSASSADTVDHRIAEIVAEAPLPTASQVVIKQEQADGEHHAFLGHLRP